MTAWTARYGPWAVVTGASDGIGQAIAAQLAARGLHVVLVARRRERLDRLATSLTTAHAIECRVVTADLSTAEGVAHVFAQTDDLEIGLLAACAGFGTSGAFLDSVLDRELRMLEVNCGAVLQMVRVFGGRMRPRRRGGIILMSSLVGFQGVPRAAHYAATKAYVQSLAEGLKRELASAGIDVVASAPGPVLSGFGEAANMRITGGVRPATVARESIGALGRRGVVRPGFLSKFLEGSLAMLPRAFRVRVLEQVMAGMTAHQRAKSSRPV